MKTLPILFSAPMVRALLAGTKTQTRWVVKPQPRRVDGGVPFGDAPAWAHAEPGSAVMRCPYGQPGDRLWVRETWAPNNVQPFEHRPPVDFLYAATDSARYAVCRWKPSIHMPRAASRITLEVTGVRVERLQDISEADAIAEGVERTVTGDGWRHYSTPDWEEVGLPPMATARQSYFTLWNQINGHGAWTANPWVWVVEFKKV